MARRRMTRAESQARTRADLLEAAAKVFKRSGYERASIAEIADEAGYSHGAVYSNFEGKEDLFLALYERWVAERVAEIDATWSQRGALAERASAAADEWMRRVADEPAPFLLRLELTVRAVHDAALREKLATRTGAVPLALRRLVEDAVEQEGLAMPVPPSEVAIAFQSLSLGRAVEALINPAAIRRGLGGDLAPPLAAAITARAGSDVS